LRFDERSFAGTVVDFDEDETCFDACDIEGDHSGGMNVEDFAHGHEFVPDFHGVVPGHPNFVTEIAGVASARDVNGDAGDFSVRDAKIFEVGDAGVGCGVQKFSGCRTLQRESRELFRDIFELDVEAERVLLKPAEAGIGGGPAIFIFAEARDGAVVDDFAFGIAPAAVDNLVDGDFVDVAGDDAVEETRSVGSGDAVFVERRNINEGGGIADGVVLVLVVHFVDADGVIAGPLAIVEAFAEGESAFVECGSDGQGSLLLGMRGGIIVARREREQAAGGNWRVAPRNDSSGQASAEREKERIGYTPGVFAKSAEIEENAELELPPSPYFL